jgi:hypothetical protein
MGRYPAVQRVTPRLVRFFGLGLWGPIPSGLGRRLSSRLKPLGKPSKALCGVLNRSPHIRIAHRFRPLSLLIRNRPASSRGGR